MKMLKLLLKLSSEYWNKHRQRFLSFAFLVMAGSAALCSVALLIRSEKSAILEEELVLLGNYDEEGEKQKLRPWETRIVILKE